MSSDPSGAALEGIRVLEICDEKGSYCGKLFADMGAEVIKLELPAHCQDGDATGRAIPPFLRGQANGESSLHFLYNNTSKKSISLDISLAAGRAKVLELARNSELLIESLPPGRLAEFGLSVEALHRENPGLVITSISGFGQSGPHRNYKTADIVASAVGGVMVATGFPEDPPVMMAGSQSYVMASTMAAASSMIALHHSRETGEGQQVDISMQETMLAVTSICGVGKWFEDGIISKRFGTGLFASVPSGSYPCKDGSIYLMVNRPLHWQTLAKWVNEISGNQEVLDPMFEGPSSVRQPYRELLDIFITELTMQFTVDELYREGQRRHLAVTPLSSGHSIVNDHHLNERKFFVDVEQAGKTTLRYPGPPYRFSLTPWAIRSPAPKLGQHNDELEQIATGPKPGRGLGPGADSKAETQASAGALTGLRIVEFTTGMAGPWIGRFMAACGDSMCHRNRLSWGFNRSSHPG
jgi:crotonobetainyl-CoA:carnitine CoA-transferase CaiB-like acyl-CoA transferase